MNVNNNLYKSFLLRLWRDNTDSDWHASLKNITTGEARNFADLADMFVYLCSRANQPDPAPPHLRVLEKEKEAND